MLHDSMLKQRKCCFFLVVFFLISRFLLLISRFLLHSFFVFLIQSLFFLLIVHFWFIWHLQCNSDSCGKLRLGSDNNREHRIQGNNCHHHPNQWHYDQ